MAKLEIEGRVFDVDGDGFLSDPSEWNEEVAALIAKSDGIDHLNEKHWSILKIIRDVARGFPSYSKLSAYIRQACDRY